MLGAWVLPLLGIAACAGAKGAATAGRAPVGADASPLAVTRAFYGALHDGDAARAAALVDPAAARPATASFVELSRAYAVLEKAMRDRFGPSAAEAIGYSQRVIAEEGQLEAAEERIQGDRAIVVARDELVAHLRRVGGAWKVQLDEALATEEGLAALRREARASWRAVERVAPAIRGGLFDVPEDALEAFRNEVELELSGGEEDAPPPAVRDEGVAL